MNVEQYIQKMKELIAKYMPQTKKVIKKAFPHAVIVAAGMMIVFFCIDRVNKPMAFMANEFHKWLSLLLAVSGIGYSIDHIAQQRRREREAEIKRRKAVEARRAAQGGRRTPAAAQNAPVKSAQNGAPRSSAKPQS